MKIVQLNGNIDQLIHLTAWQYNIGGLWIKEKHYQWNPFGFVHIKHKNKFHKKERHISNIGSVISTNR